VNKKKIKKYLIIKEKEVLFFYKKSKGMKLFLICLLFALCVNAEYSYVAIRSSDARIDHLDPKAYFQHPPPAGTYLPWIPSLFEDDCQDEMGAFYDTHTGLYTVPSWGTKMDDFGDSGGVSMTYDIVDLASFVSILHDDGLWQSIAANIVEEEEEEEEVTTTIAAAAARVAISSTTTTAARTTSTTSSTKKGKGHTSIGIGNNDDDDHDEKGKEKGKNRAVFNCGAFAERLRHKVATALFVGNLGTHQLMQTSAMGVTVTVFCKTTATATAAKHCASVNNDGCDPYQASGYYPCDTGTFLSVMQLTNNRGTFMAVPSHGY
jgi:hypothetical protein